MTYTRTGRLHGHRYGIPGIEYRPDKAKPYTVRYTRSKKEIWIGSYQSLREATAAATSFLEKERQCHPQPPASPTSIATPSGTER